MKLLFDENLSPRLIVLLASEFADSAHGHDVGLGRASDETVWQFAHSKDFVIASKDSDFVEMSVLRRCAAEARVDQARQLFDERNRVSFEGSSS